MRVHECVQNPGRRGRSWGEVKLQRLQEWKHGMINSLGTSSSLGLESMNKGRNIWLLYFQDATWLSCSKWCLATNTDSWAQTLHKWAPGPMVFWNCSLTVWHRQAWHSPRVYLARNAVFWESLMLLGRVVAAMKREIWFLFLVLLQTVSGKNIWLLWAFV